MKLWFVPLSLALVSPLATAHGDAHRSAETALRLEQKPWGIAAARKAAQRVVEVRMSDAMRFTPAHIDVKQGETLRFVVHNDGRAMHEFVLGTADELAEHAALMKKFPDMEHDEPYMAHVAPGKSGEIVWTFNRAGRFRFGCLVAGHFDAGMGGTLTVHAR